MLEFHQVSQTYHTGFEALNNISFSLSTGESVFITGHSGAGKSTLMKLILLMERPSAGRILLDGQDLNRLHASQIPYHRRHIGAVFQNHQLLFDRSVYHNVALPLEIAGFSSRDIPRRVRAALDKVGLLSKESLNPQHLSGGEQQRVGIARAVVHKPSLLLADEPTGNLDPSLAHEIMALFQQFSNAGVTVIIASHDLALIRRMGWRVLGLEQGHLVLDGAL